jgi:hypothetical protein
MGGSSGRRNLLMMGVLVLLVVGRLRLPGVPGRAHWQGCNLLAHESLNRVSGRSYRLACSARMHKSHKPIIRHAFFTSLDVRKPHIVITHLSKHGTKQRQMLNSFIYQILYHLFYM